MQKAANQILVVDDDPAINAILTLILEDQGYFVTSALSIQEAKHHVLMNKFAIALLDLGLPPNEHTPEQGFNLLNWIRNNQSHCHIIVLTGQTDTAYEAIKLGAFDYLSKPIDEADIIKSIQRANLFYQQNQKMKQAGLHALRLQTELGDGVKHIRNQAEEQIIRQLLQDYDFNVHEVARKLGLKRENIYYLIKKYNLERQCHHDDT
ncbi:response regulator [Thiomicrospira microaerophila]|uniref:response regulator n=1 Tax=Thiomicrospira microaerophila TaxID=406020 RepID=UPI0005C7F46B|nr:response regulator [Thiomicrospira microaerophila]